MKIGKLAPFWVCEFGCVEFWVCEFWSFAGLRFCVVGLWVCKFWTLDV